MTWVRWPFVTPSLCHCVRFRSVHLPQPVRRRAEADFLHLLDLDVRVFAVDALEHVVAFDEFLAGRQAAGEGLTVARQVEALAPKSRAVFTIPTVDGVAVRRPLSQGAAGARLASGLYFR